MANKFSWKPMVVAGAVAALVTVGGTAIYPQVSQAVDNLPSIMQTTPVTPTHPSDAGKSGEANPADQGNKQQGQTAKADRAALLADALGITTDDLTAAYKKAATAAVDKALADQLITKAQADALKQRIDAADTNNFRGFAAFGRRGGFGSDIDPRALLADALGISVDDLTKAEAQAQAAAIDQAVTDGNLTQEQADMAKAWQAYQDYWSAQRGTFAESVDQALKAGAITQAQADILKNHAQPAPGMGGRGMMGPGMGGFGGMMPGMGGQRGHGRGSDDWQNGQGQNSPQFGPGMGGRRGMPGMGGDDWQNGQGQNGQGQNGQAPNFGPGMNGQRGFRGMPGDDDQQHQQDGSNNSQGNSGAVIPSANF